MIMLGILTPLARMLYVLQWVVGLKLIADNETD